MTATAVCSAPGCGAELSGSSRHGQCLQHWAQAITTAQTAQPDRTAEQRSIVRGIALDQQGRRDQ